jgi:hypothetical protein
MQIFVRTGGRTIVIDVLPASTIREVKTKINDREGIPPDMIRLIWQGKALDEEGFPDAKVSTERWRKGVLVCAGERERGRGRCVGEGDARFPLWSSCASNFHPPPPPLPSPRPY